jgi:hypothetical protein
MFSRNLVATHVKRNEAKNEQTRRCTVNTTFNKDSIETTCRKQPVSGPDGVRKERAASPLTPV